MSTDREFYRLIDSRDYWKSIAEEEERRRKAAEDWAMGNNFTFAFVFVWAVAASVAAITIGMTC